MKKRHVLVFPAGTEIGLEIYKALKYCKEVSVFGAGQAISNHARFAFANYHEIPSIYEPNWLNALIELCKGLQIDYIFPAYDDIIIALIRSADKLPCKIITSTPDACEITRSKSETYHILRDVVRVPRLYASSEEVCAYPVFVKPDRGQGSSGALKIENVEELNYALNAINEPIICEYLPGDEYTVDCFSDRDKGLLFAGARKRLRIRNGISVNTITEDLPDAREIAALIHGKLNLRGAWFFQLKRAQDGSLSLLEVAPRIAGAMAAHRVLGVNFPLLSIFEEERVPLSVTPIKVKVEMDRALTNRYLHSINFSMLYLDLDDTLLVNGKVNTLVIKIIYQCINSNKQIVLLTRHRENLDQTLAKHRLSGLFDEIIHLHESEKKSAYIKNNNAIFIDDSFAERIDVMEICNIPAFDTSMIELLTEQAEFMNGDAK